MKQLFLPLLSVFAVATTGLAAQAEVVVGTLTVTEAFTVAPTANAGAKIAGGALTIQPGTYRASISSGRYGLPSRCAANWIDCEEGDYKKATNYTRITLYDKAGKVARRSVAFKDNWDLVKKDDWDSGMVFSGKKKGQSFNVFDRSTRSSKKVNFHTVTGQYCEVDMYAVHGGGGYRYGYGGRTVSAIGEKSIRLYDEVETTHRIVKITNLANQSIASFSSSSDYTSSDKTESEGECHLNKNKYKD